jgi:acetoin utilization deacetylase AcuC-like enzyme
MILHTAQLPAGFKEFGIQIPVASDRIARVVAGLKQHPQLGAVIGQWYILREPTIDITRADIERVHALDYVQRLYSEKLEHEIMRTYELIDAQGQYHRYVPETAVLPLKALRDRILIHVSGTWRCAQIALQHEFCFYLGGGMHHAQKAFGNGFCLFNDIVIALRKLQAEGNLKTAWVIDVDAHKGDGTAALTRNDPSIRTLSVHMANGWPLDGPQTMADGAFNPSFYPSDIDIPIAPGEETQYVPRLMQGLQALAEGPRPDLAIVVSGADPYEKDALPSTADLRLSLAQLLKRDRSVYQFLAQRKIPRAYLMAGGYGERAWEVYVQFLAPLLAERFQTPRAMVDGPTDYQQGEEKS